MSHKQSSFTAQGLQGGFIKALAFHHLMGIDEIRLFDTDPRATAKLQHNLGGVPYLGVAAISILGLQG